MQTNNKLSILNKQDFGQDFFLDFGKLPPQDRSLEEAVLGAIMIDHEVFSKVVRLLKGNEYFYVDAHQRIYRAMIAIWVNNEPIDLLTVTEQLRTHGDLDAAGGPYYLAQLTNRVGSSANCETHAMIIKEKWVKRELIRTGGQLVKEAYDDMSDCFEVLESGLSTLNNALHDVSSSGDKNFLTHIDELDRNLQLAASQDGDKYVIGHSFGNYTMDRVTLGLCAPDLILLAGRPGEGKTTLMLQSARQNAMNGIPVGIFSLEMSAIQVLQKLYAMETGIDLQKLRNGSMTDDEWQMYYDAKERIKSWPIQICEKGGISISELKAISAGWVSKYGVKVIYADYIQLMTIGDVLRVNSREQEIGYISRNLKSLAKDLMVPVVALSQMSRAIEERPKADRRPKNSDLRDSGSLEQDADIIVFVFRPQTHGIEIFEDGESTENATEFIISKSRMGPPKDVRAVFEGKFSRFVEFGAMKKPNMDMPPFYHRIKPSMDNDTPF